MDNKANVINKAPDGLSCGEFIYSAEGSRKLCYADDNVVRLFGCDSYEDFVEFLENSFTNLIHPDDFEDANRAIQAQTTYNGHRHDFLRYRILTKQGVVRYTESFGHIAVSEDGHTYYYVFIVEIGKEEYYNEYYNSFAEAQVSAMSWRVDNLTGLRNIAAFKEEIENTSPGEISTAAVFDIVNLHKINRSEGRAEGDKRIRSLVRLITACMPADSSFYRGYDAEIIAICPGRSEQEVLAHVEKVVGECSSKVFYGIACTAGPFVGASSSEDAGIVHRAIEEAELDLNIKKMLTRESPKSHSLTSLVHALEEVDQDTEEHVKRTRKTGVALGRRLGLNDVQLTSLELLCLLHDIGKIAIPLEILNKPGKLSDAEWAVLRSHADKGYQIAIAAKELRPIADSIRYHHERWDGRGYPAQLSGEDIPVLSRIISIVDAYDAMVNDRSYRKALSPEHAMQEIRDNAGTQFDPVMAEAFLQMLHENPKLQPGKKTGGEVRVFKKTFDVAGSTDVVQPVVYCEYKLDVDDIITQVGPTFEEITGYAPEDVIGKASQFDLVPKEDLDDYLIQVGNQFSKSDTAFLRHRLQRKDGSIITVICNGKRWFDSATRAFMSTIQIFEV